MNVMKFITGNKKVDETILRDTYRRLGAAAHVVKVEHELDRAVLHAIHNAARVPGEEHVLGARLCGRDVLVRAVRKPVLAR